MLSKKPVLQNILLITNIPTPYRIPLFNELSRQLKEIDLNLIVAFGALGYERRKWQIDMSECKFEYTVLDGKNLYQGNAEKSSFTYTGLYQLLAEKKPQAVIIGGYSIAAIKLWWRSWFYKTPYIIWSGAINRIGEPKSFIRNLQRKMLISRAAGFVAYGTLSKEFLIHLGAPPNKIKIGINTVDTNFFAAGVAKWKNNEALDHTRHHLLYIGNLTEGKRLDLLLHAIQELRQKRDDFVLDIVGTGNALPALKQLSSTLKIDDMVKFHGFVDREGLLEYFANAKCFLFPSNYDVWGLVLVEAMCAGIPCLSSIYAGATQDLITEGITGFALDFKKKEAVANRINWILDNPREAAKIGEKARKFMAEKVSLKNSANGFKAAIITSFKKNAEIAKTHPDHTVVVNPDFRQV